MIELPLRKSYSFAKARFFVTSVVLLASVGQSKAATYLFTYSDSVQSAYGILNTDSLSYATSGSMTVTSGPDAGVYSLFANPNEPSVSTSPLGEFFYDDKLLPTSTPSLDVDGLLFTGGGLEINIWGNTGPNDYSNWASRGDGYSLTQNDGTFTLETAPEPTPEPVTIGALGLGLLGLVRRKRV